MLIKSIFSFFLSISISLSLSGQVSLLTLQKERISYRQAIKNAKENRTPILAILYSPTYPVTGPNEFQNIDSIVASQNVIPIVIDWVLAPHQPPQSNYREAQNPSWMFIHPDEIIIGVKNNIVTDQQLISFLQSSHALSQRIEDAIFRHSKSKKNEDLLTLAKLCTETYDIGRSSKYLDEFIKRTDTKRLNNKAFAEIIKVGSKAPFSKRLDKLIQKERDRAIILTSLDTVLNIQRAYILSDLNAKGRMEPFFVWERYEKELGYDADSLYRLFAINYFSTPPIEIKMLYDEAFDYINYYPRSPWSYLDKLYSIVVPATNNKEDLELLMDLISFQLFREESFRQLDFKAIILYKLGQKERALSMIEKVHELALAKGHSYKSMMYSLTKEKP